MLYMIRRIRCVICCASGYAIYTLKLISITLLTVAVAEAQSAAALEQAHEKAVAMARAGHHAEALQHLAVLMAQHPDFYPAKRDYVIVAAWSGDCDLALQSFATFAQQSDLEDYLVQPVSECMAEMRLLRPARDLLAEALKKHPDNEDIRSALKQVDDEIRWQARPDFFMRMAANDSDAGTREWQLETRYSQELAPNYRAYLRFLGARADDSRFDTGDLNRLGLGLLTWLNSRTLMDLEASEEISEGNQSGARVQLNHYRGNLWQFGLGYASFAEDVPLRAKATGVRANRAAASANYHSIDYRWEWGGNYTRYHFNDSNIRKALGTSLGYAFELAPNREQRVIGEWYGSRNTLPNTLYYNPVRDSNLTLSYKIDLVADNSRFKRRVDHITLFAGLYDQSGQEQKTPAGVRYELDLDISKRSQLGFSAEYAEHFYDGRGERESNFTLAYRRVL